MAIELNDNIHAKINRPTDFRFGPFTDIAQANATIPIAQRYHGLIFGVYTDPLNIATSDITFYYYWDGLTDTDVKPLVGTIFGGAGAGLSIDGLGKIQLGNDGAGVVDYSDDSVFGSGFRIKSQFTTGTQSKGIGFDFGEAELQLTASWEDSATSDLFESYYQFQASSLGSRIDLIKSINSVSQSLVFGIDNTIKLTDSINSKGIEYTSDYEPNFTARSLVTKQYVDGIGGSKWTNIGSDIYRNSRVLVGGTTFTDSTAKFEVVGRVSQVGMASSTFFGFEAGLTNSTIGANSAFGHAALRSITTAHSNSAFGWISGYSLQSGIDNSFFGRQSAFALTNGSYNTVMGAAALVTATSASNTTALGYAALFAHPNPVNQTAVGFQALYFDNQGTENTALGARVAENLRNATTNSQNVIIGYFAAQANLTMQNSIIVGRNARPAANGQINQLVIGHDALGLGSNTSAIGNASTVFGRWWGNLLLGTSTNSGDRLRVDGTVRLDTVTSATGDVVTIDANNVLRRQTVAQIGAQVPALSAVPISYTSENTMVITSSQSSQIANQLYFDGYSFYRYKGSGSGSIINYDLVGKLKPSWTLIPNDGITTFFTSMCYGNGNFVAVSANSGTTTNKIAVSPDGFNWKYYSSAVTSIHQQIAYGNGIFVATIFFNVAQNAQRIVTSFDGINWVGRSTSADSLSLGPIVFGDGKFVTLTNSGAAYSFVSTDGINWTQSSPIATAITNFNYVTYGNGIFVACGQASFAPTESPFITSTDGLNWTLGTAYLGETFNSIAYGNGIFVAVRNSSSNLFVRSTDGINWTAITLPGGIQNGFGSIVYGDGKFIAVSSFNENASGSFTNTLFSEDGITWQTMYGGAKTGYVAICYGNGLFIGIAPSPNKFRVYGNIIRKFNENQEIFEILRKVPNYNPSVAQVLSHNASNSFTWTNI